MELDYESLGKNIRKHRALAEMTQERLADIVGCTDRHIGNIELGKNTPSLEIIVKIANALDVGLDQLVYGDLKNRTNYFVQELISLTDGFEAKDKLMSIEMVKALVSIMKEYKLK